LIAEQTADITSIVQELVAKSSWTSGNSMAIFFERISGNSSRWAYSGMAGVATQYPTLQIMFNSGSFDF
jgi:hypothetical protein